MATPLSPSALARLASELPSWTVSPDALRVVWRARDFRDATATLVRMAFEAEELGHHPEIRCVYRTIELVLRTHDAGNVVTGLDAELASRLERVAAACGLERVSAPS